MEEIESVRFCEHCRNTTPQKLISQKRFISDYIEIDGEEIPIFNGLDFIVECRTCSRLLVYEIMYDDNANCNIESLFYQAKLMWPTILDLTATEIPKTISEIYKDASKIKNIPSAFVVQIRKALEAICIDQGITKKTTLHIKLRELTNQGKLPPLLNEVSNIIKLIGNAGAHAAGPPICQSHVIIIDDFFRVILEYLYIAPSKLKKFKTEAERFNWNSSGLT